MFAQLQQIAAQIGADLMSCSQESDALQAQVSGFDIEALASNQSAPATQRAVPGVPDIDTAGMERERQQIDAQVIAKQWRHSTGAISQADISLSCHPCQ